MNNNNKSITDKDIERTLVEIGIPTNLLGFDFIATAVEKILKDPTYKNKITTRLYPEIADEYATTPNRVDRNMRLAISKIKDEYHISHMYAMFGIDKKYDESDISISSLISFIATFIEHKD